MKEQPPVSIYMITYLSSEERCEVLRHTCEWVLEQRYPCFELVVSDNGGEFSAKKALESIQDPRLKVFRNDENVGFTGNINRCLEYCSHDIIKPICDDDLIHLDFLSATVPFIDDGTLVVVDIEKFLFHTEPEGIREPVEGVPPNESRAAGYGKDIWTLPYDASCIPSAVVFSRALFKELGGYDNGGELSDWDFFVKACIKKTVVHVLRPMCYVGIWEGSETEVILKEEPFYFPRESLYTYFRVLRCGMLSRGDRMALLGRLWKGFIWQSLRPLKYPFSKMYRVGYAGYIHRFKELMFGGSD